MRFLFFFLSRHSNPFCRRASEIKPHHLFTVIFWRCTNGVISSGLPGSVEGFWFPEQADASWCGEVRGIWLELGSWYFKAKMWLGWKRITIEVLHSFTAMNSGFHQPEFFTIHLLIFFPTVATFEEMHSTASFKKICTSKKEWEGLSIILGPFIRRLLCFLNQVVQFKIVQFLLKASKKKKKNAAESVWTCDQVQSPHLQF